MILTCAHNVSQYSSLNEGIEKAKEIVIVFGKQQNKSVKQEFTDKIKTSLQLYINPENVLAHSKFKGDPASGYDIALIGIEPDHYGRLEEFISYNKQQMEK